MPAETCSITRNCVWRAAAQLKSKGLDYRPHDLCVAITDTGEPCSALATIFLGQSTDYHSGQPFCAKHAAALVQDVIDRARLGDRQVAAQLRAAFTAGERSDREEKSRRRQNAPGHVYFARRGDTVKIGFSSAVRTRIATLETQAGARFDEVVTVAGSRAVEARYHRRFAEHREIGEWFHMAPEIRAEMDRLLAKAA